MLIGAVLAVQHGVQHVTEDMYTWHAWLDQGIWAVKKRSSLLSLLEQNKAWSPISALYVPICSTLLEVNAPATVATNAQLCNLL